MSEALLFGREKELRVLEERLDAVNERGSALVLRGDAGVGKTALLDAAKSLAGARGMSILTAAGLNTEAHLPFAGLHELLHPILHRAERLSSPHRLALRAAFGLAEAPTDLFLIAVAALNLLSEFAADRPLLMLIDDAQWLDPSSNKCLAFIARRLQTEQIVLFVASRDSTATVPDVLPEMRIESLSDVEARQLLQARHPDLPPDIRDIVIHSARGHPLALVELAKAFGAVSQAGGMLHEYLPLTARLEKAFAARISELPYITRQLLAIAAMNDQPSLAEAMAAANVMNDTRISLDALTPAISEGFVRVDSANVYFTCPLARSAIYHFSSFAERIDVHAALAKVLSGDQIRSAWHQAAATVGTDNNVAERLEWAAARAELSGDIRVAIRALDRAAQLTTDARMRANSLLHAAELAFDIGSTPLVLNLLERTEARDLDSRNRVRLALFRASIGRTTPGSQALQEAVASIKTDEDVDLALKLLSAPAMIRWWGEADGSVRNQVIAALESTHIPALEDPRYLLILAFASPLDRGASVIEALHRLGTSGDKPMVYMLGIAANLVGDCELATRFLTDAAASLRKEGRLAVLAQVLVLRSWSAIYLGNRDMAIADAEEGGHLAIETEQPTFVSGARAAAALLAAWRGDYDTSDRLVIEAEHAADALRFFLPEIQMAKGTNALCAARYEDAYHHFFSMFHRTDRADQLLREYFWIGDFAEAAAQSGHQEVARIKLLEIEECATRTPSPQLHDAMHYARAMIANSPNRELSFQSGLQSVKSPLIRARLQLAFGRWLRRTRRGKEARIILRDALACFERLSILPWSERARKELRALGVVVQPRTPQRREDLTPQELQIALLAAEGFSNREIAEKLYLSHRTVSTHLYHIFPKLDITSRHQLRSALSSERPVAI